ncbi:uncharacterized protein K452DRAFT_17749 [Aplosporella prunicola CBS 121167]|uniref:Uncharacterized protein n=1 Tax=Aplosporella prunicola CBS 121167 TaxID=1176127 RepID=A0A6A6BDX6_9PEZI|nr:uncharacterized protein K452DRAFT_17749 [Aplosporella prunicola CBS 121167]KAF2142379.1 hypothetical protein K452DRAFT_17749 [Aplosporella prunicola CBS 121167]
MRMYTPNKLRALTSNLSNRDQFRTVQLDLLRSAGDDSFKQKSEFAFRQWHNNWKNNPVDFMETLGFKGIDASTAALMLALFEPKIIPICAPELYRWLHWEDEPKGKSKTTGWQRRVRHTLKEYKSVCAKTHMLQKRLKRANGGRNIAALHIWMAAYMLAREKVDVDGEIADKGTWRSFIEGLDEEDDDEYSTDSDDHYEFYDLEDQVIENGPDGPPLYDRLGYELSYEKIAAVRGIGGRRVRTGRPGEN